MNQNEYEEMFRENENAPAEAATSNQSTTQKVSEQGKNTTSEPKTPLFDQRAVAVRIMLKLADVSAECIKHERFYDIVWHLSQIANILEGRE